MMNLDLAIIGNCQISSLLDRQGRMVWTCVPRVDGDPLFCSLLSGNEVTPQFGFYEIELIDFHRSEQRYITNTAIIETILEDRHGSAIKITDFAPRFFQFDRMFRPIMLMRCIAPLQGSPRIRVRLRPAYNYGSAPCNTTYGSNHIRYVCPDMVLRLTTDAAVSKVIEESAFYLEEVVTLILGPDETIPESVTKLGHEFLGETREYWQNWVRGLSIPFEWQQAVIRAAITLKLCTLEETGAVVAAMTTSIPESPNSGRNWDYRYCWLRDGYFVVHALNRLGATKTMEAFLRYIINVAADADDEHLQPVYGVNGQTSLEERIVGSLPGY
ncbi:MAG: glycoside hydrolase family 15 protein, partial [Gammaproteobacteria bacterium]|nr:glycoside hydrolase family 15 protein [Gammaproteobacteria bacterium]